jgi:hypothetical protein
MHLEHLIESVESSAEWRAEKAAQYPNDKRNRTSAESLSKLAKKLRKLGADNERLQAHEAAEKRLVELDAYGPDITEHISRYVGRYGFDYPADGDPEPFLDGLTEHYQEKIGEADEEAAEAEREQRYEEACEAADEEAKEAADEVAKEAAEEAAKEAADEAYKEAYDEAYKEAYDEAYKDALINALAERS